MRAIHDAAAIVTAATMAMFQQIATRLAFRDAAIIGVSSARRLSATPSRSGSRPPGMMLLS
jgi:hypothetical protein